VADENADPACFSGHARQDAAVRACSAAAKWRAEHPSTPPSKPHAAPHSWQLRLQRWLRRKWRRLRREASMEVLQEAVGLIGAVVGVVTGIRLLLGQVQRGARTGQRAEEVVAMKSQSLGSDDESESPENGSDGSVPVVRRRGRVVKDAGIADAASTQGKGQLLGSTAATVRRSGYQTPARHIFARRVAQAHDSNDAHEGDVDDAVRDAARLAAELRQRQQSNRIQ
jgi:hypothetical protein